LPSQQISAKIHTKTQPGATMNDLKLTSPRPLVISAICIIGVINAIQMLNLVTSPMSKQVGAIYPTYFTFSVIISFACIVGLWLLKRYAAIVYGAVLLCNQVVLLKMGYWEITAAVIPVVIVGLLVKHLDKMS
jgi:hypothetical protein